MVLCEHVTTARGSFGIVSQTNWNDTMPSDALNKIIRDGW
jgi:hypothetical protein